MTRLHRDQVIPPSKKQDQDKPSLIREYLGFEPQQILKLFLIIGGVMVLVTIPYVLLVGFDKWSSDMQEASHMMWAGYTPAAGQPSLPPCGVSGNRYRYTPVAGTYPGRVPTNVGRSTGQSQFVCPSCGNASLPAWTAVGQPTCPSCGNIMQVAPQRSNISLAAAP